MSRESKRRAKAQRREARKRTEKTRRQLANRCAQWMYDAEDAWIANDFPRARQCFQRILHVRPTHQAANERMAELLVIDGLQAEGLRHFDRLVDPPDFPIIDFRAAAACPITERFDQGAALAQRFLRRTEDDRLMDAPRAKARLIQAECRRLAKDRQSRALTRPGTRRMMRGRVMEGYAYVDPPVAPGEVRDWVIWRATSCERCPQRGRPTGSRPSASGRESRHWSSVEARRFWRNRRSASLIARSRAPVPPTRRLRAADPCGGAVLHMQHAASDSVRRAARGESVDER